MNVCTSFGGGGSAHFSGTVLQKGSQRQSEGKGIASAPHTSANYRPVNTVGLTVLKTKQRELILDFTYLKELL